MDGRALVKSDRLRGGAWLDVEWAAKEEPRVIPVAVPDLGVVHQDDDLIVVDKPAGVAAHPSVGWEGPTVLGALAAAGVRVATTGAAERQGIVHRLDVGTSGLMVVAKTEAAYTALKHAFKEREVEKVYHAVVQGHPDPLAGTIDAPIGRHPHHSWKFAVTPDGKDSVTHYETLEAFPRASLLEIHLETGRTHQIRVHMAAHRHPCAGDPLYGADPTLSARLGLTRQWLHAHRLAFAHPATGEWSSFESPYPSDLQHALDVLREGL
jgi:23S rRNA pseudouridine1911/1915/1917 synthase